MGGGRKQNRAGFARYGRCLPKLWVALIFACDRFMQRDFIFQSRLPPHAIRGAVRVEPLDELKAVPTDVILPKRRFSACYKTDLDPMMRI